MASSNKASISQEDVKPEPGKMGPPAATPMAPTPVPTASSGATSAESSTKAAAQTLASQTAAPTPTAPAAKVAAAREETKEGAGAVISKGSVKPATEVVKAATGMPTSSSAKPTKEESAPKSSGSEEPKAGKAAALLSGGGAKVGSSTATTAAMAKAKAAPRNVAPTSAAAVMDECGMKPITAVDRAAATGSVLSRGAGAQAEAAAPKAKAKAKASATTTASKPTVSAPTAYPDSSGRAPVAPASILDIVTGTPQPALETSSNVPSARGPVIPQGSAMGPARAYAKMASSAMTSMSGMTSAGKPIELPKEGPGAVATGRASGNGIAAPISVQKGKAMVPISKRYQVVFVAGEAAPYSKTGGLGEAMDGLPVALAALGHRVMVISPRYDQYKEAWDTSFNSSVTMGGKEEQVHFFHTYKQKVDYVFVDHPTFLERVNGLTGAKLYGPEWGKDFADNQARFAYFCKAALIAIQDLPLGGYTYGDRCVVVANDWHSALVPMFIHAQRAAEPAKWTATKTTFLCHNAVFQGRFEAEEGLAEVLGVPQQYVDSITFKMPLKVGKYNKKILCVNTMAAGLRYSDRVLTVSPSYAKECAADPEKGVELEELFALGRSTGILNGVKEGVSPSDKNFVTKTKMICGTYTPETAAAAKEELKAAYRQESGLPESKGPLMCFIGRLDAQKGYDLLLEALVEVLEDTDLQVVIVGAGRADLVQQTKALEAKFPSKFFYGGWMGPERYALLAGCDYTLLPSRWEPCGLVQMEAMRMGTLPIIAPTGGLKDTVEDGVNGLWTDAEMTVEAEIDEESSASIARALRRAAEIHKSAPEKEERMKRAAMAAAAEYSWSNAALQYEALFDELGVQDTISECYDKFVSLEVDKQVC